MSGSFRLSVDNGECAEQLILRDPVGVLVENLIWERWTFLVRGVCMVLASQPYDEADYLRDYEAFSNYRGLVSQ